SGALPRSPIFSRAERELERRGQRHARDHGRGRVSRFLSCLPRGPGKSRRRAQERVMLDLDAWQEIWSTLRKNKLRAVLTACGVFWGMFMLMVLLGLGTGLERGVVRSLGGMALQSVYVWSQRTSMPYQGLQPGRYVKFTNQDIATIARVPGVKYV